MEELLEILKSVKTGVDFVNAKSLVDDGILDSLEIVTIIGQMEEKFQIQVEPDEIDPDNFQSMESMWTMIENKKKN